jgi:hypothetical protein
MAILTLFLVPLNILVHIASIRMLKGSEQARRDRFR